MIARALTTALAAGLVLGSSGCEWRTSLAAPQPGYRLTLAGFLNAAPLDPAPKGAPVLTLIYELPKAGNRDSPLDIRVPPGGKLPPWVTSHPTTGVEALATPGLYVGIFSIRAGTIRFLARVADPRNVRGETFDPAGHAVLLRADGGAYSVRVPFVPLATAVGFESDGKGGITGVQYQLPFGGVAPRFWGRRFQAVHD